MVCFVLFCVCLFLGGASARARVCMCVCVCVCVPVCVSVCDSGVHKEQKLDNALKRANSTQVTNVQNKSQINFA